MTNTFRALHNEDGAIWGVSLDQEAFAEEMVFTTAFLDCPHYQSFLKHGDGLIVIHALEGVATYGVIGPAYPGYSIPVVRARLLSVKPGLTQRLVSDGQMESL